jgi:PII-like signaling protein
MSLDTTDIIMARVYLTEGAHELDNILAYLRDESNIRGFSVFRAIRGSGETGEHASRLIDVSLNLPLVIEFFDEPETMHRIIEHLTQFVHAKHIAFWSAKTNSPGM